MFKLFKNLDKRRRNELLFVAILSTFIVGGLFTFTRWHHSENLFGQNRKLTVEGNREFQRSSVSVNKKVETILNDFLRDVAAEMSDYRKQRKVLDDLIKPVNLRDASYVESNYALGQQTIAALKSQMNDVMAVFDDKDNALRDALRGQSASFRANILRKWAAMKSEQADVFVNYFTFENKILAAYQDLLGFLYEKRGAYAYIPDQADIIFQQANDQRRYQAMLQNLENLKKQQAAVLK
ncbi:MAG: hypothetical protein ACPGRX_06315 [Bdellovibrionales bacterium]